jgi:hypothetical protein
MHVATLMQTSQLFLALKVSKVDSVTDDKWCAYCCKDKDASFRFVIIHFLSEHLYAEYFFGTYQVD